MIKPLLPIVRYAGVAVGIQRAKVCPVNVYGLGGLMILTVTSNSDGGTSYFRNGGWVENKDNAEHMNEDEANNLRDMYVALDTNKFFSFKTKETP